MPTPPEYEGINSGQGSRSDVSSADTDLSITEPAVSGVSFVATGFSAFVHSGAATVNDVAVEVRRDSTVMWRGAVPASTAIGDGLHGIMFEQPLRCLPGEALTLFVEAGGTACIMAGNLNGYKLR